MNKWYSLLFPKISEIMPDIEKSAKDISKIKGISGVYLFGSASNEDSDVRVKDVDLIVKSNVNSEDLLSLESIIVNSSIKGLNWDYLENEGYNTDAIKMSIKYTNIKEPCIDHWLISSDKKILHWGPMPESKFENEKMKEKAEKYAENNTGFNISKYSPKNKKKATNWFNSYNHYISEYNSDMPMGWYLSEESDIKTLLNVTKRII